MIEAVEAIRLEIEGPLATLILDRPRVLNAGNRQWVADLNEAVARIAAAPQVRVVVITGAGRAFCTGVDLTELAAGDFGLEDFIAWEDAMIAIERMDRLFVAGINGHCLGGGLQLALVCDYRLASEDALLGLPAVKECLIPSLALYRLPRLIGAARAQELILLGEPLDARTAERYSLVNRVVPAPEFPRALDETVERFLALPPASVRASKLLTGRAFDLDLETFRLQMQAHLKVCLDSEEHRQAMDVFRARRRS
jgi:enoyl-CoA hydratase/carnithine racemase